VWIFRKEKKNEKFVDPSLKTGAVTFSPAGIDMHLFQFQWRKFAGNKISQRKIWKRFIIYYVDV